MNEKVKIVFGLLGGLAMFLFGMNSMSDALQKAAGEKMKWILGKLTQNALTGALAGALVTAVLQSSSATTVMVIGFVSAGLMELPQAISVIFGANIGTTMTAQLMAFKISNYIYPIIFIGFILFFVFKSEKLKNIGMVIFSFGILFEGIEIMGGVMKPLASSPVFTNLMARVSDTPVLGVVLGAVMTLVVQSSSATIAVLQNFASQPAADDITRSVMGLSGAIPILLGDNIGTTITALLASIGQSKNAKRTAVAHSVFNITGSILFLFLIPVLAKFVQFISPRGNETDVISRQIANAHTTFNITCTFIWIFFIPLMVRIVCFLVRGDDRKTSDSQVKYLDERLIPQPAAAMYLVSEEIKRMYHIGFGLLEMIERIFTDMNSQDEKNAAVDYATVKHLHEKIASYITRMFSSGNLTEEQAEQTAGLLFVTNNISRITERCQDIYFKYTRMRENGSELSEKAVEDLCGCFDIVKMLYENALSAVENADCKKAESVFRGRTKMRKNSKKASKAHLARVKKKQCSAELTSDFSEILHSIDRMADNCAGIAEEAMDSVTFVTLDESSRNTNYVFQVPAEEIQ